MSFDPPIYINVRDRVTELRALVDWLERAGHQRITLLDNDSTYEPCVEYLKACPHDVVCLGRNLGSRAVWEAGLAPRDWYVYTDPDVVPTPTCPMDAIEHLRRLLDRHPAYPKAGLGLHVDEDHPGWNHDLAVWELGPYIRGEAVDQHAYVSLVDTTFALYRPGAGFGYTALRTSPPYEAWHASWYVTEPSEEDRYYLEHARSGAPYSSWVERYGRC